MRGGNAFKQSGFMPVLNTKHTGGRGGGGLSSHVCDRMENTNPSWNPTSIPAKKKKHNSAGRYWDRKWNFSPKLYIFAALRFQSCSTANRTQAWLKLGPAEIYANILAPPCYKCEIGRCPNRQSFKGLVPSWHPLKHHPEGFTNLDLRHPDASPWRTNIHAPSVTNEG